MILALHSGFEVERFAIVGPFQATRNEIEPVRCQHRGGAACRWRQPNLRVIPFVNFAGEGNALSVRGPLRIAVIPIIAVSDLLRATSLHIDDPKVSAPIIEPTSIIEFVRTIPVVPHVAAIAAFGAGIGPAIGWTDATDDHQTSSIRRPAKYADAILQIGNSLRFAAVHRQQ